MRRLALAAVALLVAAPLGAGARTVKDKPRAATAPARTSSAAPVVPPAAPPSSNARSPLGYNLDYPGEWTRLRPFIDLMHNARPWVGACADSDAQCDRYRHLSLDAQGWPRGLRYRDREGQAYAYLETYVSTVDGGPEVGKTFVVTWEGTGAIEVVGAEVLSTDLAARRISCKFQGVNTALRIVRSDPDGRGDYVRNVRMFRQDFEPLLARGELFNPEMLDYLAPFGSLRFMDWMLSNEPEERDARWSERPRPDIFPWIRQTYDLSAPCESLTNHSCRRIGGYPVEVMVALANRLGAHPHFNMPYRADDDWMRQFATYVRDHLAPGLRATVEYSNEVWNWGFPQAEYAKARGRALWWSEGTGWLQFMGMRASQMCRIWKDVFAGQTQRIRCVIAPQTGWYEVVTASLDCPAWVAKDPKHNRPCHEGMDALAVTGYFGGDLMSAHNMPVLRGWLHQGAEAARDKAFRYLEQGETSGLLDGEGKPFTKLPGGSVPAILTELKFFKGLARERNLSLYVYEGGPAFGRDEPDLKKFLFSVTTDERMYGLYRRVLDEYRKLGGTVFNAWGALSPGDGWSNGESLADRSNAKYRALVDFARTTPCWWPGCARGGK